MKPIYVVTYLLITAAIHRVGLSDESSVERSLRVSPRAIDPADTSLRLMPSETELVDGNAAVVMLRLIGGENNFMRDIAPQVQELLALPLDDPRVKDEFGFNRIQIELTRAALMRTADWGYPMQQGADLLLPDLQSHRFIAGFGMSLWIRKQLESDFTTTAMEGIGTQLACAQHIGRTPIVVNQLVATNVALMSIDRIEELVEHDSVPNLYWPLTMIPDRLVNIQAALQWESELLVRSLPSLGKSMPPIGDPAWDRIANEFSDVMVNNGAFVNTELEAMVLKMKLLAAAKEQLPGMNLYPDSELQSMNDTETVMRWILAVSRSVNYQVEVCSSLPPSQAIPALADIQRRSEKLKDDLGAPGVPFIESPANIYLHVAKFDRFIKMLQTLEAVRHHVALNEGSLPKSLDEITSLPVPPDPLTGGSFRYEFGDGSFVLQAPTIEGVDDSLQKIVSRTYRIDIARKVDQ